MKTTSATLALGSVLLLAACSGGTDAPDESPSPTTWTMSADDEAKAEFTQGLARDLGMDIPASQRDVFLDQGTYVCEELNVDDVLADGAVAVYNVYFKDDKEGTSGPLWDNAVRHLCPEMTDNYEAVQELADAIG